MEKGLWDEIFLGHNQISQLTFNVSSRKLQTFTKRTHSQPMISQRFSLSEVLSDSQQKNDTAKFNYKHSINLLNALLRFRHHSLAGDVLFLNAKVENTTNMHSAFPDTGAYGVENISRIFFESTRVVNKKCKIRLRNKENRQKICYGNS